MSNIQIKNGSENAYPEVNDTLVRYTSTPTLRGINFNTNIKHMECGANNDGQAWYIRFYLNNGVSVRLYFDASQGLFQYFDTTWHTVKKLY